MGNKVIDIGIKRAKNKEVNSIAELYSSLSPLSVTEAHYGAPYTQEYASEREKYDKEARKYFAETVKETGKEVREEIIDSILNNAGPNDVYQSKNEEDTLWVNIKELLSITNKDGSVTLIPPGIINVPWDKDGGRPKVEELDKIVHYPHERVPSHIKSVWNEKKKEFETHEIYVSPTEAFLHNTVSRIKREALKAIDLITGRSAAGTSINQFLGGHASEKPLYEMSDGLSRHPIFTKSQIPEGFAVPERFKSMDALMVKDARLGIDQLEIMQKHQEKIVSFFEQNSSISGHYETWKNNAFKFGDREAQFKASRAADVISAYLNSNPDAIAEIGEHVAAVKKSAENFNKIFSSSEGIQEHIANLFAGPLKSELTSRFNFSQTLRQGERLETLFDQLKLSDTQLEVAAKKSEVSASKFKSLFSSDAFKGVNDTIKGVSDRMTEMAEKLLQRVFGNKAESLDAG